MRPSKHQIHIQMKKWLLAASILMCSYAGMSQELQVQRNTKGLYLNHTVSAKENFYSVGRMYGISPKDMAAFNNLDMNNGLVVGQTVMIPLNATNFSQSAPKGVPVYYTVGVKEGLYRVSLNNNKVLLANLRKWNKLANDNISTGQKLVIGYLNATEVPAGAVAAKTEPVKEEPRQTVAVVEKKPEPVIEKKPEAAERKPEPIVETRAAETKSVSPTPASATRQVASGGAGYFKNQFDAQSRKAAANKEQTATSGIFKTASGWTDAKYYALIDNVEPGTIIRVTNPSNNKAVYAKVLGEMSGIRQNAGLELRLSNAAASALDVTETDKFIVRVNY
jgi:LysM repeat protein